MRYYLAMPIRPTAIAVSAVGLTVGFAGVSLARADTFGGFSGVDRPYLVNPDRVCAPLAVVDGAASGAPKCQKAGADVIARLSIKDPILQSGAKATFVAQASGRTITVTKKAGGAAVVTWSAFDPIARIVETYADQYADRIAVAYNVRRGGKEVTDVVAFDLGPGASGAGNTPPAPPTGPSVTAPVNPANPTPAPPEAPADPKLTKAIAAARAATGRKAAPAWRAVLAIDPAHTEAQFRIASAEVAAKHNAEAIAALSALASSERPDAIEWLVEARFAPAFAALRGDPKFRTAVGLDRKSSTMYERMMGFGGQWEQNGTSCDKPEVRFTANRDRSFRLRVKTTCEGSVYDTAFKGTWRITDDRIVLQLPTKGKQSTTADEAGCGFEAAGDEEALRCTLGRDIDFLILPTRR